MWYEARHPKNHFGGQILYKSHVGCKNGVKATTGSVQVKIGNGIENFDLNIATTTTVSESVRKYFELTLPPMIPNIFTSRIAHEIGLSEIDVKYAGLVENFTKK